MFVDVSASVLDDLPAGGCIFIPTSSVIVHGSVTVTIAITIVKHHYFHLHQPPPAPLRAPPSQVGQRMEPPRDRRASPPCLLPDADGASTPACRGVLRQSLAKALAAQAVPGAYTLCYPGSLRTARTPAAIAEASAAGSRLLRPAASPRPTMELAAEVTADGAELWAQRARTQLHG